MQIPIQEIVVFAVMLGGATVFALGFGLRVIAVALSHEGKERIELIVVGVAEIVLCGGFFVYQFIRIISQLH